MKNQLRAIGDFWRQEYGRFVGMTAIAFLVLTVLAYIAGRLFPDIPVTVMSYFNDMIDSSGIVQEDGSFSVLALLGSNVRAMVLSALYGFIPFLYLPALSLGLNAAIIGMLAAMMQGQWLLFAAGILLPAGVFCGHRPPRHFRAARAGAESGRRSVPVPEHQPLHPQK